MMKRMMNITGAENRNAGLAGKLCLALILSLIIAVFSVSACAEEAVVTVSDVNEFLSAIAPSTEIRLEKGCYDLADAETYGKSGVSDYYRWDEIYDGFELVISGVEGLSVVGSDDDDVVLSAEPRYANVLTFEDCSSIRLAEITAGHTEEPGVCAGGVISLRNTENFSASECSLYGCGILGLQAVGSRDLTLSDCEIYDCSSGAVLLSGCRNAEINDCEIRNCGGNDYFCYELLRFESCADVRILNCEIEKNRSNTMLSAGYSSDVVFTGNEVKKNVLTDGMFRLERQGTVVDGCEFKDNEAAVWYQNSAVFAVDAEGAPLSEADLEAMCLDENVRIEKKKTEPIKLPEADENGFVHVSTADEFLAAIYPGASILMDGESFDLASAENYGSYGGEYYYWRETYDGPELVISGCDGLSVTGNLDSPESVNITAFPRYANVLYFEFCNDLVLSGFTAGHEQAPGDCAGGVLYFDCCGDVTVDSCRLYGCGILGISANASTSINVLDTEIYDCTYGGASFFQCDGIRFSGCSIHDVDGPMLTFTESGDKLWNGTPIEGYGNFDIADSKPVEYDWNAHNEGYFSENAEPEYPQGMRAAEPDEEFPLGFIENMSWKDAKAVFDVPGPETCSKVMFKPGWLPFEPDNSVNAWAEDNGWFSRLSSEATADELRPKSMQGLAQPFLIDIYYSAQFGSDGHPILLYNTPDLWTVTEEEINGHRTLSFSAGYPEQTSEAGNIYSGYVLMFNEEQGYLIRITGQADLQTLKDIAWSLEVKTLDEQVSYDDFDGHNVFIDCGVG